MTSRRLFLAAASAAALRAQARYARVNCATEFSFESGKTYPDPFNALSLDVVFTDPQGIEQRVPAFWAGDHSWRVRFSPGAAGRYRWRTVCSDAQNPDLQNRTGDLTAEPYTGDNPLRRHGPLRASGNRRYLQHADGTPFFWLGDTWWMGLCARLRWPEDFQFLAADRVRKGFTVIQIVAGLYPDMPAFDPRGVNEAGFPWEKDYARINPRYFDMADLRIQHLVDAGLTPCIVGCWGYHLPWLGEDRMKQHWRNLVARWGAYPVVWCLAGEGSMPWYLTQNRELDSAALKKGWTGLARYVRSVDPYRRLVTIHPSRSARETVDDPSVLDFDMLQTGHGDRTSIENTVKSVRAAREATPVIPVVNGEVCYEGILGASREEIQRFMFWACWLSGACGFTYGANGIWQVNLPGQPYGPSPHGRSWGDTPWKEASQLPGSTHLGRSKSLLERFPWWRIEPHPEWVEPRWAGGNQMAPLAAGIAGELRVIYLPGMWNPPKIKGLESGVSYEASLFDMESGSTRVLGSAAASPDGDWQVPPPGVVKDWILVLRRA